ncbi:MAG: aminopeptidase P family protein [Sinobacteraceae bacterium]|nr:aminopeptidase P family protein [Nevskiaceae bacterium]
MTTLRGSGSRAAVSKAVVQVDRRAFLLASGVAGVGTTVASGAAPASMTAGAQRAPEETGPPPPRLGPLLNRGRAYEMMRRAKLDGLVVTGPLNVYYLTNAVPVLSRFSQVNTTVAVVSADSARPIAYVAGGFEYYAGASDSGVADGVKPYLVGGKFGQPDSAADPAFDRVGSYSFDAREQHRRSLLESAAPFHPSMAAGLAQALRESGLTRGVVGFDTAEAAALLRQSAPQVSPRPAEDVLLHIRLVKSEAELELMRRASANNVAAAMATAGAAREEGSVWRVRQRFFKEAAARGNLGVYASVDLVMSELADGAFREGQAFMIDFVSHYAFYQGDYGRTVFFGEPDRTIARATRVGVTAWQEIRARLRPGVRFSEIRRIGNETVRKLNEPFLYAFNPHSVGLQHWDQPRTGLDGTAIDLALEPGMVLSVDCPLLNAGVNGTTHIEDLMLITASGSEPIHRVGDEVIRV